jgi:hypothetical protein
MSNSTNSVTDNRDYLLYSYLLTHPENIKFNLFWYDEFGKVDVRPFAEDSKFHQVTISKLDPQDVYDIVFNNNGCSHLFDQDIEEIYSELIDCQETYYNSFEDDEERPFIKSVTMVADLPKKPFFFGETIFF